MIAAANDMIPRTFVFDAKRSRHGRNPLNQIAGVSIVSTDPYHPPRRLVGAGRRLTCVGCHLMSLPEIIIATIIQ
jgi:hypothetical protein